jgi:hypothetical protein
MQRLIPSLLIVCCAAGAALAGQAFHDDFAAYRDGATGEPNWNATSVMWEMRDRAFRCASPDRAFAIYAPAPYANDQVIECTLTISGKIVDQWKIAGIVVFQDGGNFWHLALVESPDADGGQRFVELVEAYNGGWLSEGAAETKLTPIEHTGGGLHWAYDHPYRLRLRLTADRIEGTVSEADGRVISRIAYRLDNARAVRAGCAGLDSAGFASRFNDFRLEVMNAVTPPPKPSPPPGPRGGRPVGSWPELRSAPTGFFRVEERGGRGWLFDPDGRAFYVVGTDHANFNVHWCEALGYAPYHRNMVEKFGSEDAWAKSTVERLKAWGFNTLAANNSPSLRYQGLAHIAFIAFGQSFAAIDDICPQVHWTGFPNVFNARWKEHCRKLARAQCAPQKDDPWLIGYFLDNELEWFGKSYQRWSLADEAFKKPASHSAKIALVAFLRERYHDDIAAFNRAWGTQARSFDALLRRRTPIAEASDAARADKQAFVRLIAERYFSATADALREFDPNHLNLGCRFAGDAPEVWDIAGKHCDIVSVNCYREADLDKRVIVGFEQDLRRWHDACRRPMMITEWSFPALDSGLPCEHGAGQRFDTQSQRAAAWQIFQELLFRTPFVVGSDYFMWVDEPALGISKTFREDTNYGLVNERDEPYQELTETATRVNAAVYRFHAGELAELRPVLSGSPLRLRVRNQGRVDAEPRLRIWVDGKPRDVTARVPAGGEIEAPLDAPASPGAHFVQCVVDPDGAVAEGNRSDNEAHTAWYAGGLPWPSEAKGERQPIVVANPTDVDLKRAVVPAPLPAGRLIATPALPAHSAAVVLLYDLADAGAASPAAGIAPGVLTVAPAREGEEAAVVLTVDGARIGHLAPLVWQKTSSDQWLRPRLEAVETRDLGSAVQVRATMRRAGADAAGVIGRHDQANAPLNAPRAFSCEYSALWVRGRDWFTARLDWLRSDDPQPWDCRSYYHYLLPDFDAPEVAAPRVPGYYRPLGGWWDERRRLGIGAMALAPEDFSIYFRQNERGGLHPDASCRLDMPFRRGRVLDTPQPVIVIFAARGEPLRAASLRIWREARAERALEATLPPREKR